MAQQAKAACPDLVIVQVRGGPEAPKVCYCNPTAC
jgi:hypothetical protein